MRAVAASAFALEDGWPPGPTIPAAAFLAIEGESENFDLAAFRPGRERAPFAAPPASHTRVGWGAALSLGAHAAILAALLFWSAPIEDVAPPEPIAVEIVADAPPADQPPPAPRVETPPTPSPAPTPTPLAEAPTPPPTPAVETPPPVAEAPPPSPEPTPTSPVETPPVAEAPPSTPEPTPTPVAEAPTPTPSVEAPHPRVAEAPPATAEPEPAPTPIAKPSPRSSPVPEIRRPPPREEPRVAKPATKARPETRRKVASLEPESAASSRPTAPAVASRAEAAAYQNEVLGRIASQKRYPEAARERDAHGVAVVRFSLNGSGELVSASLARSAGDAALDAEAVATVRRAAPFPAPPSGAPRSFSASLSYRVR
jgi:protein TonB